MTHLQNNSILQHIIVAFLSSLQYFIHLDIFITTNFHPLKN